MTAYKIYYLSMIRTVIPVNLLNDGMTEQVEFRLPKRDQHQ